MKRVLIVLLAALLVLAVGCKKQEAEVEEEIGQAGAMAGGWAPAADYEITEARQAIFEKGLKELVGVNYAPVAYLGSQVVAGTNHVYLAQATVVYPGATPTFVLIYLYEDLQGKVQLMTVADMPIVPQADGTATAPEPRLMGGWSYADDPTVTDEMLTRLDQALEGLVGATYMPVANLGEQVVAGLNRCLLCQVSPVVPDAQPHYALVYVYEDLQGGGALNQVIDLDVGALCTYGA